MPNAKMQNGALITRDARNGARGAKAAGGWQLL